MRTTTKVLGAWWASMAGLATWGGLQAFAQAPDGALLPVSEIVAQTPVGPVQLDLGNLTMPGAIVLCVWLILQRGGLPIHLRVSGLHRDPNEDTGTFRIVPVTKTDD